MTETSRCRCCGYLLEHAFWKDRSTLVEMGICDCCGAEAGVDDLAPWHYRIKWLTEGAAWFTKSKRPDEWDIGKLADQLSRIPAEFSDRTLVSTLQDFRSLVETFGLQKISSTYVEIGLFEELLPEFAEELAQHYNFEGEDQRLTMLLLTRNPHAIRTLCDRREVTHPFLGFSETIREQLRNVSSNKSELVGVVDESGEFGAQPDGLIGEPATGLFVVDAAFDESHVTWEGRTFAVSRLI